MGRHQLFKIIPPKKIVDELVRCYGFDGLEDKRYVCKKHFSKLNVLEKVHLMRNKLEMYYMPCKRSVYLDNIGEKNIMTVLRQVLRCYNYKITYRERYLKGDKIIMYNLEKDQLDYIPIIPKINKDSFILHFD
tara:strand:- start:264 stop:662 length:399 start_codon:yes stop_codon:yes gene_type:complete